MALPDHLADLERKISARLNEALAEIRHEMRRAAETGAQRATSAMLSELEKIGPLGAAGFLAEQDLLEMAQEERREERRAFARTLRLALVDFDHARTQGAVLEALLASARRFGDRVALWLMRPQELLGWASLGFAREPVAGVTLPYANSPALQRLAEGRGCILLAGRDAVHLASVLEMETPNRALLVPMILRDRVAAVLYVDSLGAGEFEIEALQILTIAAAQKLELQALATRSYTPTLFLEGEAPASERGLSLWDPDALDAERASGQETAAEAAAIAVVAPAAVEEEHDTLAEAMPTIAPDLERPAPVSPLEPSRAEIAWQMEEAEETVFLESVPHEVHVPARPQMLGTPTHEIPILPSSLVPDLATSEWREVDETTAPHSTVSAAATQLFTPTQAVTNEFPQPAAAASQALASLAPLASEAASTAATIAFAPPGISPAVDLADDATVMIQRSGLQPTPPPPAPAATEPEAAEEQTHPSIRGPGIPDDEPTVSRTARTTEVIAPPDLQGPGWAFSGTRSPRGSSENALHEEARRLARLLVSEIKLYNEDQVEEGRRNRDIYHRLKEDIDRSRQIYEERVHESVRGTTDYFQQELIRSLAGGDPRALGI